MGHRASTTSSHVAAGTDCGLIELGVSASIGTTSISTVNPTVPWNTEAAGSAPFVLVSW